ncbi:carboxypeptidase regulatory-like domain-containing protein [Saccharopolyspora rosea]|uniref:alpha-amylase n=1 Tax=Saccharopolyspora rosea TaxID=524884 RepID=A0ABW3FVX0_9PSEU|nr:carboxypeptidase regulatory-like domain-containing protein [Saccharopolyspora rosea]
MASDPGLTRLRLGGSGAAAVASVIGVEYGLATLVHADGKTSIIMMMLGAMMAMMGSMALTGPAVWPKVRTAAFFPVAMGCGLLVGSLVGAHPDLMLVGFVVVMFVAVLIRRFGPAFFFYGFMGWMGYFFASFTHATPAVLPPLLVVVVVAAAWILLLNITVLRANARKTLRRTVRAFSARARAVTRACADLLEETEGAPRQLRRLGNRVRSRQAQLAEAALMVEAWSAEDGAVPPEESAPALRRKLIDAQQAIDRMAAVAGALADGDASFAGRAAEVADLLARRDDTAAEQAARQLANVAEQSARAPVHERLEGWLPARQFAAAALEFVTLAREVNSPARRDAEAEPVDEFQPVVGFAMGNLPGSPAVAAGVPARGRRWNPLARLDMTTRQAFQVAVAGGLAIVFGRELSPERYYWAVIAAFVMFTGTATRAETFIKGFNRVVGTLVGLVASIGLAELTAGDGTAALAIIVASIFCGFYLFRVSYAYMIFFITIVMGQLYTVLHEFSPGLLLLRLEETAIGAVVGFVVAFAVTPLSTRDTVRTARDNLLAALAELLDAAADRLAGSGEPDLDALTLALDDRMRQLTVVAKPLMRPMLWGNSSPDTRHRMALYGATTGHARELAIALRHHPAQHLGGLAPACRALATAATRISETGVGRSQPAVVEQLAQADIALFNQAPAEPGERATDPFIRSLIHLRDLLRSLAVLPVTAQPEPRGDGAVVLGRITDTTGEPLHGRVVLIADTTQRQVAAAYSDASGRYRVEDCPPGSYLAVATATGHEPVATRVAVRAGRETDADFTVAGSAPDVGLVRGVVRDGDRPRSGAAVTVLDAQGGVVTSTRSDAHGHYELPRVPAGDYTILVPGYPPLVIRTRISFEAGRTLTLDLDDERVAESAHDG